MHISSMNLSKPFLNSFMFLAPIASCGSEFHNIICERVLPFVYFISAA